MSALKRFLPFLLALALLPFTIIAAIAAEAEATTWLNVRSGPGTGYGVVDTMAPGESGNITECDGSWCFIERSGPDGWVSSSYLTAPESPSDPDCSFSLVVGAGGPHFAITCGNGGGSSVTIDPGNPDRVCFFKNANYTGQSFCRSAGTYNTMPAGFNNSVTSIRVHGNAKARICEFANMGPFCRIVSSSENHLGAYLDNEISSFRVFTGFTPVMKQVCLFDHANYSGDHLCLKVGTHTLPALANDRATSVLLLEGAKVRLCKSATYCIGPANYLTSNTPMLGPLWNNQTSSVRVE